MPGTAEYGHPAARAPLTTGQAHRRVATDCYTLEAVNSLASAYYFNYLFFYMERSFGFGNQGNLLLTALYGFVYTFAAWYAGHLGPRLGYFRILKFGCCGMLVMMSIGGLLPRFFGYTNITMFAQPVILGLWTLCVCCTWPTLQSLLSLGQSPAQLSRTAGLYNIVWASGSALAYLTGGALLDFFGGEVLFWLPVGIHVFQLYLLNRLKKDGPEGVPPEPDGGAVVEDTHFNPRPIARARMFLRLAWLANPVAYVAIYGILPVIPDLARRMGLSHSYAGLVCSIWFWVRLGAFVWFWLWPGWHYRFGLLVSAFVAMIASFVVILLGGRIWTLILAEVVFGLSVGLIYYSSLFYSMDAGASKGKKGGIHEAAIGLGTFLGPSLGFSALHWFPGSPNAGTWSICAALILGLGLFLGIRFWERIAAAVK